MNGSLNPSPHYGVGVANVLSYRFMQVHETHQALGIPIAYPGVCAAYVPGLLEVFGP